MNSSSGNHLSTNLFPTRCYGTSVSVSAYLKCLASRGWAGLGFRGLSEHHVAIRRTTEIKELSSHLRNDIDMSQGQYLAAQLASVLEEDNRAS